MSPMTFVTAFFLGIALYSRYKAAPDSKAAITYRAMHTWHFALTCTAMVMLFIGSLAKYLPEQTSTAFGGTGLALLAIALITQITGHGIGRRKIPDAITSRLPKSWFHQMAPHPAATQPTEAPVKSPGNTQAPDEIDLTQAEKTPEPGKSNTPPPA